MEIYIKRDIKTILKVFDVNNVFVKEKWTTL